MSITADQEKRVITHAPSQLFVGGEWRDATGGATLEVEDPSTGETIATVADATPEDAASALDAACGVQAEWAAHPPRERGEILRRAFEAIVARKDELALLMTLFSWSAVMLMRQLSPFRVLPRSRRRSCSRSAARSARAGRG